MYQNLVEFLGAFSASNPVLWTLLTLVVTVGTALFLYVFWEVTFRLIMRPSRRADSEGGRGR